MRKGTHREGIDQRSLNRAKISRNHFYNRVKIKNDRVTRRLINVNMYITLLKIPLYIHT